MKSNFEVTGLEAYLEALQKAGKDVDLVARAALAEAGTQLQSEMIRRVPVKTGIHTQNLKDHIKIFTPAGEGHYNYVAVGFIRDARYTDKETMIQANSVEFGTPHSEALPFIRPAVRAKKASLLNLMRERLKAAGLVD
jgi:HK97 gp10 family phage protein